MGLRRGCCAGDTVGLSAGAGNWYFLAMTRENSLFDERDPAAEAAADARAEADVKAGRLVGHDEVKRWVASWGTEAQLPRPKASE